MPMLNIDGWILRWCHADVDGPLDPSFFYQVGKLDP